MRVHVHANMLRGHLYCLARVLYAPAVPEPRSVRREYRARPKRTRTGARSCLWQCKKSRRGVRHAACCAARHLTPPVKARHVSQRDAPRRAQAPPRASTGGCLSSAAPGCTNVPPALWPLRACLSRTPAPPNCVGRVGPGGCCVLQAGEGGVGRKRVTSGPPYLLSAISFVHHHTTTTRGA